MLRALGSARCLPKSRGRAGPKSVPVSKERATQPTSLSRCKGFPVARKFQQRPLCRRAYKRIRSSTPREPTKIPSYRDPLWSINPFRLVRFRGLTDRADREIQTCERPPRPGAHNENQRLAAGVGPENLDQFTLGRTLVSSTSHVLILS